MNPRPSRDRRSLPSDRGGVNTATQTPDMRSLPAPRFGYLATRPFCANYPKWLRRARQVSRSRYRPGRGVIRTNPGPAELHGAPHQVALQSHSYCMAPVYAASNPFSPPFETSTATGRSSSSVSHLRHSFATHPAKTDSTTTSRATTETRPTSPTLRKSEGRQRPTPPRTTLADPSPTRPTIPNEDQPTSHVRPTSRVTPPAT